MTWMEDEEAATEDGNEIAILTDADKRKASFMIIEDIRSLWMVCLSVYVS
jgi:hypothetical protein